MRGQLFYFCNFKGWLNLSSLMLHCQPDFVFDVCWERSLISTYFRSGYGSEYFLHIKVKNSEVVMLKSISGRNQKKKTIWKETCLMLKILNGLIDMSTSFNQNYFVLNIFYRHIRWAEIIISPVHFSYLK